MSTSNAQSGRAAAIARRKAQVQGKGSQAADAPAVPRRRQRPEPVVETAVEPVATTSTSSEPSRRPRRGVNPVAAADTASAAGRNAAKARRQQQKNGKSATSANTTQPQRTRAQRKPVEPIVEAKQERTETVAPAPRAERANSGRAQVKPQTNQVQSGGRLQSKAYRQAQAKGKAAQDAFKSKGGSQSGAKAKLANPDASARDIAKQVRAERCSRGKTCSTGTSRPTRQQRNSQTAAPSKVEESQTLSGQTVSGTMVGQGEKKMTGAETGACQLVSGTEYLGSEEFAKNCQTQPSAQPAKVTQTQTTRGQVVSGSTKVGRGESMTGNEVGTCSAITGTEYLPADQSQMYCGGEPAKAKKTGFSVMSQPAQSKANKITSGGENRSSQSTTIKPKTPAQAPQKVMPSQTSLGNTTTGTQVGRLEAVTGSEKGACKSVTGTGYQGKEEAEACNVEMPKPAIKVTASATTRGQSITGERSGGSIGMTGAEAGDCQAVTGTPYTGAEQSQLCSVDQQNEMKVRQRQGANKAVSGVQPGLQGLTGAQKGACQLVSGTNYQGPEQTAMVCDSNNAAIPGESDFPQMMGAAQAPVQAQPMAPAMAQAAPMPTVEEAVEQGAKITGDGWDRGSKVTGTEGPWAAQRNSSVRGQRGQSPMGASQFRPQNSEVPMSPITGSSGNTDTGAKVTLSGGARA
ncbi:CsoS2 family carboxysome shell protein [Thiomicrorhabdus xiamenensis]|uniref:Carboxysome shell protein n=1 Tax=Thiomicrorhabdus xiamenensis TaxID=2739063 RepID=A0A7D4TC11_9GAMM|nr:CsoS2 family carboxysome shell protein [Thiomicrorhabdus xiamenensis]QKI90006.1 carboxysome shell protein [Thiomicrorhabdus xiamenensis]